MRPLRQRLLLLAIVAFAAGIGAFALGTWTTVNQTFASIPSSGDLSTTQTFTGPSSLSIVTETTLSVLGVALVALAVVAVAGFVASLVVDGARQPHELADDLPDDPEPPAWSHEVVDNGS